MSARVLVVDDIPANVRLLEAKLAAEYFDVITADSGAAALELVAEQPPDIVLLDVMMPGMDGFEVCQRIKANPQTLHIPVVMVTALSEPKPTACAAWRPAPTTSSPSRSTTWRCSPASARWSA